MTRKEAIKWFIENPFYHKDHEPFNMAIKALEQEPKIGHWILGGYDEYYYICDRCKFVASEYYAKPKFHYCPNCGAKMI